MEGAELDLAVAKAIGKKARMATGFSEPICIMDLPIDPIIGAEDFVEWMPSTRWSHGGPLVDEYNINLLTDDTPTDCSNKWEAEIHWIDKRSDMLMVCTMEGPTALIAAMRALVKSKGEE